MNSRQVEIEEAVIDYLTEIESPFSLDDVFETLNIDNSAKLRDNVRQMLLTIDDFVEDNDKFYPKSSFLTDIPLRIMPTEFEIKKGIWIPGHRLLPFYPTGLPIDGVSFSFNHDNSPVKTRTVSMKMAELHIYFNLMDLQKIPILNIEDILEENSDLKIQVCQMKDFYKKFNFQTGDSLVVRSIDFNEGLFTIAYDSYDSYQHNFFEIEKKDRSFMKTLKKVMKKDLFFPNVEKQLLYTYYYMKQNKQNRWMVPGTALGPLLGRNKEVTFSPLPNGRTIFHFVNQSIDELAVYPDFEDLLENGDDDFDLESIDGILKFLNNNNGITIVRAFLFDMITEKRRFNFTEIENYLFDGLQKPYMPPEFRKQLKLLMQQEYRDIKKAFNLQLAYLPITTARKKILEQALVISRFLRGLDEDMVSLQQLPKNEMMHLMELYQVFDEILQELDRSQISGKCDSAEIHRIVRIVERVSGELPALFSLIRSKLNI